MLDAAEHAAQQHRHGCVVAVEVELVDGPAHAAEAGIVEHHVQASEAFHGGVDRGRHIGLTADIGADEHRPVTQFGRDRSSPHLVKIRQHHAGPFGSEQPYRAGADPAGGAGDDRDLALQPAAH